MQQLLEQQPETRFMHSLLSQALEQEGLQPSSHSIYIVKSGVLASIVPWSDFSILQVRHLLDSSERFGSMFDSLGIHKSTLRWVPLAA